jgi:ABC-2 type transport system ATP-binding protein
MTDIVLEAQGLTKYYGKLRAVHNLSLEVKKGEVLGFLGPNGAGKTTSINMLCGLLKPDSGQIYLNKHPVGGNKLKDFNRVGVCPQEIIIWDKLTCLEQIIFIGRMYGLDPKLAKLQSEILLEKLGLEEKKNAYGSTLSGGMKRRLNLAMALVHDPGIVILDEPVAGLDPQTRIQVREFIQSLAEEKTIILTTHNMDEADRLADRVAIIDYGELLVLDTPENLKQRVGKGDVLEINSTHHNDSEKQSMIIEKLASLYEEIDYEVTETSIMIRTLDAVNRLPLLLETIKTTGVQIGEVRLRPNTLEDVFIQLTGRRLRE